MKGVLILENGQKFYGNMLMDEPAVGEVVFNTGMTGYQETFTDPSYAGQIITMTYPLIGNYGLFHEIEQADRPYAAGFIVSELCEEPSNWQNEGKLSTFIMTHHIPCLYGVDTRAITRAIRSQGVMKGVIVPETMEESAIKELFDTPLETQLVRRVTTREIKHMGDGRFHVAVMDYGAKANILRELVNSDCRLTLFPAETKAEEVLADDVVITHRNLHDNTLEGFEVPSKKIMCVQYHPEASPGPTDNLYLFTQFVKMMEEN